MQKVQKKRLKQQGLQGLSAQRTVQMKSRPAAVPEPAVQAVKPAAERSV
jgi:hypothetical protein